MSVKGVISQCFIMALFIRNDGERLLLGDGLYQFKSSQKHFAANTVSNTVIDVQGSDGVLLAGQTRRAAKQSFAGYVGDATVSKEEIERARRQFISFSKRASNIATKLYISFQMARPLNVNVAFWLTLQRCRNCGKSIPNIAWHLTLRT